MAEEKKPIEGQEFLRRAAEAVLKKQSGRTGKPTLEDEAAQYDRKTKAVEAQHRFVTTVDGLQNPPSVQQMREKREQQLEDERRDADQRVREAEDRDRKRLEQDREDAARQAAEQEQKNKELQASLQTQQNQMLLDKIEELRRSQKPMQEQLNEYLAFTETLAAKMGFEKPSARPASEDPHITLEITKLQLQSAREGREFEQKMEQDRRKWEMELQKLQIDREFRKQELEQTAKKDQMFASFPEAIGSAFARGVMDSSGRGAPQQRSIGHSPATPQAHAIRIGEGESGTIGCAECESVIEVAPTTTVAQCLGCNARYPVTRVPAGEPQPTEEE